MSFTTTERRRQLCTLLRATGFKVRMHSYQYFIRGEKVVCVLILHPHWQTATLHRIKWNRDESVRAVRVIARLIKTLDPELAIEIV
jgi:hypothetical protein